MQQGIRFFLQNIIEKVLVHNHTRRSTKKRECRELLSVSPIFVSQPPVVQAKLAKKYQEWRMG
jgi:hypothetical protein